MTNIDENTADDFKNLIETCCTHVETWDDLNIPSFALRVFGWKKAVQEGELCHLKNLEENGFTVLYRCSQDEESKVASRGNWFEASCRTRDYLSTIVRESQRLPFFQGLLYEMTYNNGVHWTQGQLSVLLEMPAVEDIDNWKPISLMLAPLGAKSLPVELRNIRCVPSVDLNDYIDVLKRHGWSKIVVHKFMSRSQKISGHDLLGRRYQYPIRPRIACTIHKVMGADITSICTEISNEHTPYKLWDRQQVVVLLSRTSFAKDIVFVGKSGKETAEILLEVLKKKNQYSDFIENRINKIVFHFGDGAMTESKRVGEPKSCIVTYDSYPFRARNIELPATKSQYVYLLCDGHKKFNYIGSTSNLVHRFRQHQYGDVSCTKSHRPWILVAYVIGFSNKFERIRFEGLWQLQRQLQGGDLLSINEVVAVGDQLIIGDQLRMVHCVDFNF